MAAESPGSLHLRFLAGSDVPALLATNRCLRCVPLPVSVRSLAVAAVALVLELAQVAAMIGAATRLAPGSAVVSLAASVALMTGATWIRHPPCACGALRAG